MLSNTRTFLSATLRFDTGQRIEIKTGLLIANGDADLAAANRIHPLTHRPTLAQISPRIIGQCRLQLRAGLLFGAQGVPVGLGSLLPTVAIADLLLQAQGEAGG